MSRVFRKQHTRQDTRRALDFYADMAGKPRITGADGPIPIAPPKADRIRRADGKPLTPTEHQEQVTLIQWWRLAHAQYQLPELALFAVPNGGARDAITGKLLKDEGVRAGALDLILAAARKGFHGLFVEMKVGDNKPSPNQLAFIEYLTSAGYKCAVHWSSKTAQQEIEEYLA